MSESCFVCEIDLSVVHRLEKDLIEQGFELKHQQNAIFAARKPGIQATLYQSGKFVIQGKEMKPFIEFYLEPEILRNLSYSHPYSDYDKTPRIGVDEAGKGDFFGPLSISAVFIEENQFDALIKLGIKDSKKLSDPVILKMSDKIKSICATESIVIFPARYNELYEQFKNLNLLLAWGHSKVIELLTQKTKCKKVILDQFASSKKVIENALQRKNLDLDVTQMHKAEQDLAVAAASIIARANFLNGIEKMNTHFKMTFPKGASNSVKIAAKQFIQVFGRDKLFEVAKLHFKTTQEVDPS